MNVRAAFRAFVDTLKGRFIRRTANDTRRFFTLAAVRPELVTAALNELTQTGYMRNIADIYDMMPATDMHIQGVRRQLRAGVQGIEIEPIAVSDVPEARTALEAVKAAEDRSNASETALRNGIVEGSLRGAALTEVMWDEPIRTRPTTGPRLLRYWKGFSLVPQQRLRYNWQSGELMLITDPAKPGDAVPMHLLPAGKFIRSQVDEDIPDFALRGINRTILNEWLGRVNVHEWELMAIERYGMPIPVGKFATPAAEAAMRTEMQGFGAAGMLIVDSNSSIEWGTNTTKELVHETYLEKSAERISIAYLGATQTVTIAKNAGSKASAGEHQEVRKDILFAYADLICECKRRDLWIPFLRENFGEGMVRYCPNAAPQFDEPVDLLANAQAWAVLKNDLGYVVPIEYVNETTGITFEEGVPTPKAQPAFPPAAPQLLPAPKAIAAAREHVPLPETPPAFGREITDALARIVGANLSPEEMKRRLEKAAAPPLVKSADLLAAEMLRAHMRAIEETRKARGAA